MKRSLASFILLALIMAFSTLHAAQAFTQDDAKGLVGKVAEFWKANGKDKALAEVSNPKGQFVKGDLYAFCNDLNGVVLANGGNPGLVGQNHAKLKDPEGKLFNEEMIEIVKTKGSGWTDYSWVNPVTKKVQPKTVWVERIKGTDVFCGAGIWK
ncbi:MAG TPA: cache domain-containing protein [Syntrophorhabdaceae bacterium]|nr:cache domain-containing protein [Syntrophorhabdaceae bacterium]